MPIVGGVKFRAFALASLALAGAAGQLPAMAFDAARARVVLFGGVGLFDAWSDTWLLDGSAWTEPEPRPRPPPRSISRLVEDRSRSRLVLWCDMTDEQGPSNTWEWNGDAWAEAHSSAAWAALLSSARGPVRATQPEG